MIDSRTIFMFRFLQKARGGMSLIITLSFIVILSILIVAFFSSTMREQSSSTSFPAQTYQQLLVDATIGHATALLAGNIPPPNYNPVDPALNTSLTNWWINPGRLSIQEGTSSPRHIPLYTTPVQGQSAGQVNLNALTNTWDGQQIHPIEPGGSPLEVSWVEVLRNPLRPRQSNRAQPNYNPIIGRYALWIDSDTNRINFQTALGVDRHRAPMHGGNYDPSAGNFFPMGRHAGASTAWWVDADMALGLPTTVSYAGLTGSTDLDYESLYWNNVHQRTSSPNPATAARFVPWLSKATIKAFLPPDRSEAFWENNRFNITHHSTSPEFNVFGKPRMATHWFRRQMPEQHLIQTYQLPFSTDMLSHIATRGGDAANITALGTGTPSTTWTKAQNRAYQLALGAYLQYPVPGLGTSFRDKWALEAADPADVLAEIDQFSYNLQTAAAASFDPVSRDYPAPPGSTSTPQPQAFNGNNHTRVGGLRAFSDWETETPAGNRMTRALFPGVYSGRGIGRHINAPTPVEIALRVTPRQQSAEAPNILHLEFALEVDFFLPEGFQNKSSGPDWGFDLPVFRVSYLECRINGQLMQARVRHTGTLDSIEADPTGTHYLFSANAGPPYTVLRGGDILSAKTAQAGQYAFSGETLATPNVFFAHRPDMRSDVKANLLAFAPGDAINITDIRIRIVTMFPRAGGEVVMAVPSSGRPGANITGMTPAASIEEALIGLPDVEIGSALPGLPAEVNSTELSDPRLSHRASAWQATSGETLGALNSSFLAHPDRSKLTYVNPAGRPDNYYPYAFWYPYASSGFIYSLPTGQQRGLGWRTINLAESQADAGAMPPDYLLADLVLPTAPDFVKQHASIGKININSRIYPDSFGQNIDRGRRVLESTVSNLRYNSTSSSGGTLINAGAFADWMVDNEPADGFPFAGRVLENPNLTLDNGSEHARELLRSKVLGLFTTQSNTFTMHGMVETVDDLNGSLRPRARHTFQAMIERQIFPGRDGIRGNGRTDANGNWIKVAGIWRENNIDRPTSPGDAFDAVDGPDPVDLPLPAAAFSNETSPGTLLEDSFNPVLPYYIYEVLQVTPMDR